MAISEQLQNRIANLTGDAMAGMSQMGKGAISNKDREITQQALGLNPISDQRTKEQIDMALEMMGRQANKGAISDREMEIFESTMPRFPDGSPLPEGMVPGMKQTMEFRDYNQNGIEDRAENIYLPSDLVPQSSLPPKMNTPEAFFATPPEGGFQSNMPMGPRMQPMPMPMPNLPIGPSMQPMPMDMVGQAKGAISNREMEMFENSQDMSEEDRSKLEHLLQKGEQVTQAPLASLADQLKQASEGEDTELAHLRPGEVVIPPEFLEDTQFESMLERKFDEFGIDPEAAVAGIGIASLNATTGLEQFGFFKKIGKSLKKVVKKVAPVAMFIPGVGTALGGALGGLGGLATKGLTKIGLGGVASSLGGLASTAASGIAGLGIPGISSIAGGTAGGFGGIMGGLKNPLAGGMFGQTGSTFAGGPQAGKGLANRFGMGSGTQAQVDAYNQAQQAQATLNSMTPDQLANMDTAQLQKLRQVAAGGSNTGIGSLVSGLTGGGQGGGIGSIFGGGGGGSGGGGGLGGLLGMAGAGALAAKLGKLAFDETKGMTGVPLTPLTTMDASGRYNIEAEIARRMGQDAPNPVEFGLLPAGTFPELSGGKPQGMMYGGSVMPMAYAEGGNVAVEDFERMNGGISGPGTETSDDVPAMLSDGEFVMTGKAVRGAGGFNMDNNGGIITLTPSGEEDRNKGTDLMYEMMGLFESYGTA